MSEGSDDWSWDQQQLGFSDSAHDILAPPSDGRSVREESPVSTLEEDDSSCSQSANGLDDYDPVNSETANGPTYHNFHELEERVWKDPKTGTTTV